VLDMLCYCYMCTSANMNAIVESWSSYHSWFSSHLSLQHET
jgi:hypothetical protein